jgi:hypothetical protein
VPGSQTGVEGKANRKHRDMIKVGDRAKGFEFAEGVYEILNIAGFSLY